MVKIGTPVNCAICMKLLGYLEDGDTDAVPFVYCLACCKVGR